MTRQDTILVVEDEVIVAADLERSLRQLGYRVLDSASSGEEALERVNEDRPDLVLMDVRLAGPTDGIDTAMTLRRTHQLPVVYLTAYADARTLDRAKRTEPLGYLVKPVKPAELRSVVEVALYRGESERKLRKQTHWMRATLGAIGDGVLCTDAQGAVSFVNAAAERLLGVCEADVLGKPIESLLVLLSPSDRRPVEQPVYRALREQSAYARHEEYLLLHMDGSAQPVDESVAPVSCDGELLGAVLVLRDLSEKKRLEQQVQASSRLASLGTLSAGIAHEVNNPLSIIVGSADLGMRALAREHARDGAQRTSFETLGYKFQDILHASMRIRDIVNDLGVFAPLGADPAGTANVSRAALRAIQATAHELHDRARLVQDIDRDVRVNVSETRIVQVLVNLLVNAAQAIEPGHAEDHEVRLTVRRAGDAHVLIELRDTGHGMPPEVRARAFEPFFTTRAVGAGSGLGLSVCHGIVTSAGGHIEIESVPGSFTTVRACLPAVSDTGGPSSHVSTVAAPGKTVLLIDDDAALCRVMSALIGEPHHVTICTQAEDALSLVSSGRWFDLILCDVMMSHVTGVQFFERLHAIGAAQATRVVFITGGAFTNEVSDFLRSVPNRCLLKPLDRGQLEALLREPQPDDVARA